MGVRLGQDDFRLNLHGFRRGNLQRGRTVRHRGGPGSLQARSAHHASADRPGRIVHRRFRVPLRCLRPFPAPRPRLCLDAAHRRGIVLEPVKIQPVPLRLEVQRGAALDHEEIPPRRSGNARLHDAPRQQRRSLHPRHRSVLRLAGEGPEHPALIVNEVQAARARRIAEGVVGEGDRLPFRADQRLKVVQRAPVGLRQIIGRAGVGQLLLRRRENRDKPRDGEKARARETYAPSHFSSSTARKP